MLIYAIIWGVVLLAACVITVRHHIKTNTTDVLVDISLYPYESVETLKYLRASLRCDLGKNVWFKLFWNTESNCMVWVMIDDSCEGGIDEDFEYPFAIPLLDQDWIVMYEQGIEDAVEYYGPNNDSLQVNGHVADE